MMRRIAAVLFAALAGPTILPREGNATPVGSPPPPIEAKEWVGGPALRWEAVRGKVVVLFFVEPDTPLAKQAVSDLAELARAGKEDFIGCIVTCGPREKVQALVQATRISLVIALDDGTVRSAFEAVMSPYAVVVDRDGKVAFEGSARLKVEVARAVDEATKRPRKIVRTSTTRRFAPVFDALDRKEYKTAIAELLAIVRAAGATEAERSDARSLLDAIAREASGALRAAEKLLEEKEYADALAALDFIAVEFEGITEAEKARARAEAVRGDRSLKRELEASSALREARALEASGDLPGALRGYRQVASKWRGTRAAERASKRARSIEAQSQK